MNKKFVFNVETSASKFNTLSDSKEVCLSVSQQQEIYSNISTLSMRQKFENNKTRFDKTVCSDGNVEVVQSWNELFQTSQILAKPSVPPKPTKSKALKNSCLLQQSSSKTNDNLKIPGEEGIPATVNTIRQKFEEKFTQKNSLKSTPSQRSQRSAAPKVENENDFYTKKVAIESHFQALSRSQNDELLFEQKIATDFYYNGAESSNSKMEHQCTEVEFASSIEEETKEDRLFTKQISDSPKGIGQSSRQRFSYAEPRTRYELMPTMSFSGIDSHGTIRKKKYIDAGKKQLTDSEFMKKIQHITDELIKTEKDYINNLFFVIMKYGSMFTRRDLPRGLVGKRYDLFGNIEQIAVFHRDTLLPMFERNKHDIQKLCEEFANLIDNGEMYDYVLYTINKRRSLAVCSDFVPYFEYMKQTLNDLLGIESFLLQPIQRLPRYQMLINKYISEEFHGVVKQSGAYDCLRMKKECDLEKKIENLLKIADEAEHISNIQDWHKLNICNSNNKFRKALEFYIYDRGQLRGYGGRIFIFEKFMIYTEIMGNDLMYRGYYDASEGFGLFASENSFTMADRNQLCDFRADASYIKSNLKFIEDMIYIRTNARLNSGEKSKIDEERFPTKSGHASRCDSGLGNMFTLEEESDSTL